MTLHFQTKALREAVNSLQPILGGKGLPVLSAVEITPLRVRATNLDIWIDQLFVSDGTPEEAIRFRVSGILLGQAMSRIKDAEVTIETNDSHAILKAGSAKLSLPLVIEPLPSLPEVEWSKPIIIDDLQKKLRRALPFVGKMIARPLNMAIHFGEGKIEACDGRRFIGIKDGHCTGGMIVPTELCQLVAKTEGAVTIRASKNLIEFAGEDWTIAGTLIESTTGAWMNTDCMYDRKTVMSVKTSATEAIEAVSLAAFSLPKEIDSVRWILEPNRMLFAAKGENPTETECAAEVDVSEDYFSNLGVSSKTLISALKAVTDTGNDEVELRFSDSHSVSVSHDQTEVVFNLTRL